MENVATLLYPEKVKPEALFLSFYTFFAFPMVESSIFHSADNTIKAANQDRDVVWL